MKSKLTTILLALSCLTTPLHSYHVVQNPALLSIPRQQQHRSSITQESICQEYQDQLNGFSDYSDVHPIDNGILQEPAYNPAGLTQAQRDWIIEECQWQTQKAITAARISQACFAKVRDVPTRTFCISVVTSTIVVVFTPGFNAKCIGVLLSCLATMVGEKCEYFWEGYDKMQEAQALYKEADRLQERLWINE